jgi:hypothetical protein
MRSMRVIVRGGTVMPWRRERGDDEALVGADDAGDGDGLTAGQLIAEPGWIVELRVLRGASAQRHPGTSRLGRVTWCGVTRESLTMDATGYPLRQSCSTSDQSTCSVRHSLGNAMPFPRRDQQMGSSALWVSAVGAQLTTTSSWRGRPSSMSTRDVHAVELGRRRTPSVPLPRRGVPFSSVAARRPRAACDAGHSA